MSASPLGVSKLSVLDGYKGGMMHIPTLGSVTNLSVLIVGAYCGEVAGEKTWSRCCICAIPCQTMAAGGRGPFNDDVQECGWCRSTAACSLGTWWISAHPAQASKKTCAVNQMQCCIGLVPVPATQFVAGRDLAVSMEEQLVSCFEPRPAPATCQTTQVAAQCMCCNRCKGPASLRHTLTSCRAESATHGLCQ